MFLDRFGMFFGDLDIGLKMGEGKLSISKFDQKGGDLMAEISGDVSMRSRFSSSAVSGCVKVKGDAAYLSKNPNLKSEIWILASRGQKIGKTTLDNFTF